MKAPFGCVGVPCATGAVVVEDTGQALGKVGQMFQRHRTVLDERDRFAVPLHGHHDVQAGFSDVPDRPLFPGVDYPDHTV